eukprot:4317049-Pyramimonas_sp.AAC.1
MLRARQGARSGSVLRQGGADEVERTGETRICLESHGGPAVGIFGANRARVFWVRRAAGPP